MDGCKSPSTRPACPPLASVVYANARGGNLCCSSRVIAHCWESIFTDRTSPTRHGLLIRLGQTYQMTGPDRSQLHHAVCGWVFYKGTLFCAPPASDLHRPCWMWPPVWLPRAAASVSFLMLPGCPCHEWLWRAAHASESLSQSLACTSSAAVVTS